MNQTYLILLFSVLSTVAAQLCLKRGVLDLGNLNISLNNFFGLIPHIFQSIWLLGGLFLYGISFVLWIFVISKIKLNTAYPIATSLNFSLVVIFSWLFLKEQIFPIQILGIAVILFGIFLLLKS